MLINHKHLTIIAKDLDEKLKDSFITNIFLLNSTDFVFAFSFYRDEKLLISLNHFSPFVSFIGQELTSPTILNKTNEFLRKEIKNSLVKNINTYNDDRILEIILEKRDEFYQKKSYKVLIELIPHRSNFIVLNDQDVVIFATTYTTLDSTRHVLKGFPYEPLEKTHEEVKESPFSLIELKTFASEYIETALTVRKKEKYKTLYTHLKGKINSLKRKIKELEKEYKDADKYQTYQEIGENLYYLLNDNNTKKLEDYISSLSNYDHTLSVSDNAQMYFKKYKKAMRSKEIILEQIALSKQLLEDKTLIFNSYPYLDENELQELNQEYLKIKRKGKPIPSYLPSYIIYKTYKIAFGKNSKQNNYLTFKYAKKNHHYFHIADYSGSHVLILNETIDDDVKLIASEIALLLSNKEEGDIQYTLVKNIKKGSFEGEALLNNYSLISIHHVRKETKDLLFTAKRFSV